MNTTTWNWEILAKDSYCIKMRLYKRYFMLTVTWNNLWGRWQVLLTETNKLYDLQFSTEKWYPIELSHLIAKSNYRHAKNAAFRKAVILICELYEDESTRIIECFYHLH